VQLGGRPPGAAANAWTMTIGVFRIAAVAAFLFLSPCRFPPQQTTPRHFSRGHKRRNVGWAYGDGTLNSARETFAYESPRSEASRSPARRPIRWVRRTLSKVKFGANCSTATAFGAMARVIDARGFTGSVFWQSNVNGYTVTERGRSALTASRLTSSMPKHWRKSRPTCVPMHRSTA